MRQDYFDLKEFERVQLVHVKICFVLVACKYREIVLFFSYKG